MLNKVRSESTNEFLKAMGIVRRDLGSILVHWTKSSSPLKLLSKKSTSPKTALDVLFTILTEQQLKGSCTSIRGQHKCVCFTEMPLSEAVAMFKLQQLNEKLKPNYEPYGIVVSKKWLFLRGGRPVFYMSSKEYGDLPENLQWRYMKYDPMELDFTWEREWRIRKDSLKLIPLITTVLVKTRSEKIELRNKIKLKTGKQPWRIISMELFGL